MKSGGPPVLRVIIMAMEIEAKLAVESHMATRERLVGVGAEFVEKVLETNYIFDRPDGSLRGMGCGLRVRESQREDGSATTSTLTFKGRPLAGPYKKREEVEIVVSDAATAARLLEHLGYVVILKYEKRRERWRWRDCRVELDEPPRIGRFVEIEGPGERAIRAVQADLGLADVAHTSASYVGMLLAYCQEHGIEPCVLNFEEKR